MAGLGVVGFFAQAGWATLNFSALPMWVQFHLHQGRYLGFIVGAFMVTEAVFRPFLGSLSDRIGRRPVILAGPAVSACTSVATLFMPNAFLLIPLRAIDGIGLAGFWTPALAIVGDTISEEHRSTAMSVLNGSAMAGIAMGWLFGGLANDVTHTLAGAFYFVALIFVLTFAAGVLLLPRAAERRGRAGVGLGLLHLPEMREVLVILRSVPDMLVLNLIVFTAIGLIMPIMKLYAVERYGLSETRIGVMVAPAAAALGIGAVPLGRLSDRWGALNSVRCGLVLCAFGMWLEAMILNLWVAVAAAVVVGVGFMASYPAWMAIASEAAPEERRGRTLGAVGMAESIGAIFGAALGPLIYASHWNPLPRLDVTHYNAPFYLSAALLSSGVILVFTWVAARRGRVLRSLEAEMN